MPDPTPSGGATFARFLAGLIALGVASCARPAPPVPPTVTAARTSCAPRETKLRVVAYEGRAHRAFVEVERDGLPALFLLDTGAPRSHFRHALTLTRVLPAQSVRVGCEERWLESRASRPLPPEGGRAISGTLGLDALSLSQGIAELDLSRGRLRILSTLPREARAWPSAPLVVTNGVPLTHAMIDGRAVRLLLDTGTEQTTMMVADEADLGRGKIVRTTDAFGNPIALTEAIASVAWGDDLPARAPVYRTASFPAFEEHAHDVGGIDGILGLASFGLRRVYFDVAEGRVWLEPVAR